MRQEALPQGQRPDWALSDPDVVNIFHDSEAVISS